VEQSHVVTCSQIHILLQSLEGKLSKVQVTHYLCFCVFAVLFHCHDEHQCAVCDHGRCCHTCPVSCICSFPDSPYDFDSVMFISIPWQPWINLRSGHVGFVVDLVGLWQVSYKYFGFPCQFPFYQLLHIH
jgi:hypothetical protein